jgi:uncharacterized protein YjiS (DUF1127 family)
MLVSIAYQAVQNKSIPLLLRDHYSDQHRHRTRKPIMRTDTLPRPIPLQRALAWRVLDAAFDAVHTWRERLLARLATYAEYHRAVQAERELARLSPGTLQDIGAPQGLVGQRRWQEEHEAAQLARLLNQRGW